MSPPLVRVGPDPLDPSALMAVVRSDADGAVVLFTGVVRNHNDGRAVRSLEYDAYPEMAERELEDILSEARERWPIGAVAVQHRTGTLGVGEPSVAVAAASPHRAAAFAAARYVIEELKTRVPIWKREGYVDGASEWLRECTHVIDHAHE